MKIEASITLNLKIPELTEAVIVANRLAMRDTVVEVAGDTVKGSPWLTGNNARSIAYEVGPGGEFAQEDLTGAVYSTSGYGGFLEVGTNPHIIRVKTAKVLTDGESFFGKEVHHPGTKPHPYFKPALDKNFTLEKFTEKVQSHLK